MCRRGDPRCPAHFLPGAHLSETSMRMPDRCGPANVILAVGSFEGAPAASFGLVGFVGSAWQSSTHELRVVLSSTRGKRPRLGRTALWESRLRESAQGDKWSFCLTAGKISPRIRREHEQETAPEPCIGL